MTLVINNEDEFNSTIKGIFGIIISCQGNFPALGTPQGKELQVLTTMAFEYVRRTNPSNPDPMETIIQRLKKLGYENS